MEILKTQSKIQEITNVLSKYSNKNNKQLPSQKVVKQPSGQMDSGDVINVQNELALLQAKHNDLNKRLKECDKNLEIEEKALLENMNNYDEEIVKRNNIEDRLTDMGVKKEEIVITKKEEETYV